MTGMDLIYAELAASRVNVEVMFSEAINSPSFVTCRLRPWKGNRNAQSMVLSGGNSVEEAIYYAYVGFYSGTFIPLDWSLRATTCGVVNQYTAQPTANNARPAIQFDPNTSFGAFVGPTSSSGKNGPQNGSEGHSEPIGMTGRNKPKN